VSIKPTFSGEVQFRRYSDTSTQGVQIVLSLHDREALEPLVHLTGKRFMAVLVQIGDDEQPVEPAAKEPVKLGPLCREAVGLCQMPEFQEWLWSVQGGVPQNEALARGHILFTCGVESRKELDSDARAADAFVRLIRIPFMKHMKHMKARQSA
jgi:hypothetical protein